MNSIGELIQTISCLPDDYSVQKIIATNNLLTIGRGDVTYSAALAIAKVSNLGSATANIAREAYTLNEGAVVYCAPEAFTCRQRQNSFR
jgi:hypothetical protein